MTRPMDRPMDRLPVRVYYEDTDAGGVVYHASYLRYLERARTEFLRSLGVGQGRLRDEAGLAFAVRSICADYLKPARLDDELSVTSFIELLGRAQVTFRQSITRGDDLLLTATVRVACIHLVSGRPAPMPRSLHDTLKSLNSSS